MRRILEIEDCQTDFLNHSSQVTLFESYQVTIAKPGNAGLDGNFYVNYAS
jgi:hypothetical protein